MVQDQQMSKSAYEYKILEFAYFQILAPGKKNSHLKGVPIYNTARFVY